MGYDYNRMCADMDKLLERFPFIRCEIIGYTVMKKPIYSLWLGDGEKKLFVNCAHHGLEYLTSLFVMKFIEEYAKKIISKEDFYGLDANEISKKVSLAVVPMVNPDGVDIAVNGLDITNPYHQHLISMVGLHSFNKVWQANSRGVDINHNYNAGWRVVKTVPGPTKYSGPYSESEPETKAIVDIVRKNKFDMLMAFHSQGGEIYYDFDGMTLENSKVIAEKMAKASGYTACKPEGSAVFGGCKDWFIKEFGRSGFTIEMGHGENPLPEEMLKDIYTENAKILAEAMSELAK